ncbi:hypothetical protein [Microbulbifer magnicolonia]|uniref:hypothetical protein n=1 Tax=Microbulbifer magnicolonia TaxID=3109744 RepID=UPI002B40CECA|nr:hypothetical protein [Microbulbifer sp. GG15]
MIYKIFEDSQNYQSFTLDVEDYLDLLDPHIGEQVAMQLGTLDVPVADFWKPLDVTYFQNEGTVALPDIGMWRPGFLILNQKAEEALHDLLSPFGEFLPCNLPGGRCCLYHCLNSKPIEVDQISYRMHGETHVEVESLTFPEPLKDHIFKARNEVSFDLFCSDEVVSRIDGAGLRGLLFSSELSRLRP